jgi:hypothetical protein
MINYIWMSPKRATGTGVAGVPINADEIMLQIEDTSLTVADNYLNDAGLAPEVPSERFGSCGKAGKIF